MEAHGGYLCRYEDVDAAWLQQLARSALAEDGQDPDDAGLQVTLLGGPRLVRFAFDGPFTYGRLGARWYLTHHALARRLSEHLHLTVHAYSYDPEEQEQVVAFGAGRRVGGEVVNYGDFELEDADDEAAYAKAVEKWPLGHLARVLGVNRNELIRVARRPTALIDLKSPIAPQALWALLPNPTGESLQRQAS
jgi:hypothetical protein